MALIIVNMNMIGSGTDDGHTGIESKSQIKMSVKILKKGHNRLEDE